MACHILGLLNRKNQSLHGLSDIKIGAVVSFLENNNTNTLDAHWHLRGLFLGTVPVEYVHYIRQGLKYGVVNKIIKGEITRNFNIECIAEQNMLHLFKAEEELYRIKKADTKKEKERLKEIERNEERGRQRRLSDQIKTEEDNTLLDLRRMSFESGIYRDEQKLTQILKEIENIDHNNVNDILLDELGYRLTQILLGSIIISKSSESILSDIVAAYLNIDDVSKIINVIGKVSSGSVELTKLLDRLKNIQHRQKGIHIEDISDPFILSTLGNLHKEVKAYKRAYRLYTKSYAANPQNSFTLNGLGAVCRMLTLYEEGKDYYSQAYKAKGNNEKITNTGLAALLVDMSYSEENYLNAEKLLLKALELEDSPYPHKALGRLYMRWGYSEKAELHFFHAYDIDALFNLVKDYEKLKDIYKVVNCLNRILELDFKNEKANQIMSIYKRREIL